MGRKKKVDEEEEEEVYHVEVISKARVGDEGDWEYFVKWAGYDSDANSWEPAENVKQCDRLLASFWKHVGIDDEDYSIGYEVDAGEDWINKEKRYFAETFIKPSRRKAEKEAKKKEKETRRGSKLATPHDNANDSESSNDEPLAKLLSKKGAKRKGLHIDTESESGPEDPLQRHGEVASGSKAITPPIKEARKPTQAKRQDSSSTTPVIPKVAPVRTHQDQRVNPLVKPMNLPAQSVEGGSLLTTKQRIAAGMPPPPTGPKPLQIIPPKKSLSSLSFKKSKPPISVAIQAKDSTRTSSTLVTSPGSPIAQPINVTDKADLHASPEPMDEDQPTDLFGSFPEDSVPQSRRIELLAAPLPPKRPEEIDAEMFLHTVNIPALSAPLEHISETSPVHSATRTTEVVKPLAMPKIPKKWKWTGELFISSSGNKTELLCLVTIADPTGMSNSSHISLLMSAQDSIRISRLHPIMDLSPIMRACGTPQYFGQLDSNEPGDEVLIQGLKHHMTNQALAAVVPLLLDDDEVAVLIVFPATQLGLAKVLEVPEHLTSGTPLLVVLLPLLIPSFKSSKDAGWRYVHTVMQSLSSCKAVDMGHELPRRTILSQATSLLGFPKSLLDFLSSSTTSKAYSIWPLPAQSSSGLDTALLQYILRSTKATSARLEDDVRVVFICNRNLETLHTMPCLVSKRVNSPETQFWTYGYSTSVTSSRWGLQEIFPLGGIITFTPTALAEDPVGCCQLMSQVVDHPLWHCYLIPEVLAVSHLLINDDDCSLRSPSCLDPILDLIEAGLVCATKIPGQGHSNCNAWLSQVLRDSTLSAHDLLGVYISALREHPTTANMSPQQLVSFTNNEITQDLAKAQIQPVFMDKYRRFVVIRAASEGTISAEKDEFEWCPLALFSFRDDYFQVATA